MIGTMIAHLRASAAAALALGLLLSGAPSARAEAKIPPLSALTRVQLPPADPVPQATESDDPPPRAPIERITAEDEARAAEARQRAERASEPAYKRWWFWALGAAAVAGAVTVAVLAAGSDGDTPARGCTPGALACFGDGRR